jgi:hypothetical protein
MKRRQLIAVLPSTSLAYSSDYVTRINQYKTLYISYFKFSLLTDLL